MLFSEYTVQYWQVFKAQDKLANLFVPGFSYLHIKGLVTNFH